MCESRTYPTALLFLQVIIILLVSFITGTSLGSLSMGIRGKMIVVVTKEPFVGLIVTFSKVRGQATRKGQLAMGQR